MRGAWLTRSEICQALKLTQGKFDRGLSQKLKWTCFGSRKKFFLPESKIPAAVKKNYEDSIVEYMDNSGVNEVEVDDMLNDVTDVTAAVDDDLAAARLENLKARTSLINEKLENRKQELWAEWNEAFFETFSEAFAKFKNELISLHLNEEQLKELTEKLENALKLMKDKLDAMYTNFSKEDEEQEK